MVTVLTKTQLSVLAAAGAVLLALTRAAEQTGDSLLYTHAVKTGSDLLHPHHLLFGPAVALIARLLTPWCNGCDAPVVAGQLHNIAWAVVAVVTLSLMVSRVTRSTRWGLLAGGGLLASQGVWELATQSTVYTPALGSASLLAAVLLRHPPRDWSAHTIAALAGLLSLAVLYHQANVLLILPIAAYAWSSAPALVSFRQWGSIVLPAGIVVLVAYAGAYVWTAGLHVASPGGFIRFCLRYTSEICVSSQCDPSPVHWGNVDNWRVSGLAAARDSLLWMLAVVPARWSTAIGSILGAGVGLLASWALWTAARGWPQRAVRYFFLVWLVTYATFLIWWLPSYSHPFVLLAPPLAILACLAISDVAAATPQMAVVQQRAAGLALVGVVAVGIVNYWASVAPRRAGASDTRVEAAEVQRANRDDCLVLTSARVWGHLRYYFDVDRVAQIKFPLSYFYRHEALPERYRLDRDHCVLANAVFVRPDYRLSGLTESVVSGFHEREQWLAYLDWLFSFERDPTGRVVAARDFEVVPLSEGGPYLKLLSTRRPVDGLAALLPELDRRLSLATPREPGVFTQWLGAGDRRRAEARPAGFTRP